MRLIKKIILWGLVFLLMLLIADVARYFVYPDVSDLKENRPGKTAFMEYREEVWLEKGINKKISTSWVPLSQISPYIVKAVIIAEDDKFWSHEGFDYDAIQKAIEKDIKKKKFAVGGSTISQQLAKNLYLSPSKNPVRKIKEAILTWRIEKNLSKKRIIELYVNVVEWGDGIFGIDAAARKYFGKRASALSAREAARLAAVLPNPRKYNPVGSSRYVENRSERIYNIMVRRGIVIQEYEDVISEPDEPEEKTSTPPQEPLPPDDKVSPDKVEKKPDDGATNTQKSEKLPLVEEKLKDNKP